jgi:predicted metalloprotease with PDZ domain
MLRLTFFLALSLLACFQASLGQSKKENLYNYTVDLTRVSDDKVYVELSPPSLTTDVIQFYFPKIVPGTYAIADYGRYIADFSAFDKKGKKLSVEKIDDNSWKISGAKKLAKISYFVNDSWDTPISGPEIFWPAGTNIEEGKNYVVNTSGFFGYFKDKTEVPFQVRVVRPKELYGSTGLIPSQTGVSPAALKLEKIPNAKEKAVDIFRTTDYDELIDSPLMYSKPDTAVIRVADTEVLIGSYSPTGAITAKQIAGSIRELLMAQKEFLGGKLPVEKYAFIFYFTDKPVTSYGALEHSYSSMYYMPEATIDKLQQEIRDVASHEFFHIVTPLSVHSEQIENFDFNDPKMSQHLWMYEGVTEYFASLVQVKYGLIGIDEFVGNMQEKMFTADPFLNDVPFTDISKYTLDKYHDQYYNVYQKGALIGLCLDLKLRKLSQGKYGLQNLMLDLSKKFGKKKAFEDEKLFDEITAMTYPEIGDFFNRYVKGSEKLPLKEVLQDVGIVYVEQDTSEDFSLGINEQSVTVAEVEGKQKLMIASADRLNEMGQALGFKEGDILIEMNGQEIPELGPDFPVFYQQQMMTLPLLKSISYKVLRTDEEGGESEVALTAPVKKVQLIRRHHMEPAENPTPEQLELRSSWVKP